MNGYKLAGLQVLCLPVCPNAKKKKKSDEFYTAMSHNKTNYLARPGAHWGKGLVPEPHST
jgi:hypothetical protein